MKPYMVRIPIEEHRFLKSIAIAITEAILTKQDMQLTPDLLDVYMEWLESPHGQSEPTVVELVNQYNKEPE